MAWTTPKENFVNGDVLTATQMNNIGGDLSYLKPLADAAIPATIVDAKGDLIGATANDTPARIAVGTDGQYLMADSASAAGVKWAGITAGGITLIATATPSAATTVSFTSIPTTYKQLLVTWHDVYTSTTGNYFGVRLNNDSSGSYDWTGYGSTTTGASFQSAQNQTLFGNNAGSTPIGYSPTSVNYLSNTGYFQIFNPSSTTIPKLCQWGGMNADSTASSWSAGANNLFGKYRGTSAITRLDFIRSGTETITGTFYLYGIS